MSRWLGVEPLDTLFLRGAVSYNAGEPWQTDVFSTFPPPPSTLAGALRVALARHRGWPGGCDWSSEIVSVLGSPPGDFGLVRFGEPVVLRGGEPLWPAPNDLRFVVRDDGVPPRLEVADIVAPGPVVWCDLGHVRLSCGSMNLLAKSRGDVWLTSQGMQAALGGQEPAREDVVQDPDLFALEPRVGLALERDTRRPVSESTALYSPVHVRPRAGVSFALEVEGLPDEWCEGLDVLIALGGEGRMASVSAIEPITRPAQVLGERIKLVAVSPACLEGPIEPDTDLEGCEGWRVVSMCSGSEERIGGFDGRRGIALDAMAVLPAGAVIFLEAQGPVGDAALPRTLGLRSEDGFGRFLIGTWTITEER